MEELSGGTPPASGEVANDQTGEVIDQNGDMEDAVFFEDIDKKKEARKEKDKLPAKAEEALKTDGKPEPKKEAKGEEKKPEAKKAGEKEEKPKVESKKLKAKHNDKELDIEEDAVVTVKVDGKDVEVPIKDLLSNYSGKTAWDKRFSELDKERKTYKQMKDDSESKIKAIFDEQDPEMRFYRMAEFSGTDPVSVRKKFLDENMKLLEKWYSMSDDEKKADELAFENKYLKHQTETVKRESELRQAKEALNAKVESLLATHKIEKQDFVKYYDNVKDLVEQGKLEQSDLNYEFVANAIMKDRLWASVDKSIADLKIEGVGNDKIMHLVELAHQEGLAPEDIADVVNDLWGPKKIAKVIDEKEKQRNEFYEGSKEEPVKKQKTNMDVWSFDQI